MTYQEFCLICAEYTIAPSVAIENASVRAAIVCKDESKLRYVLEQQF